MANTDRASDRVAIRGNRRLFAALACGLAVVSLADALVGSSSLGARISLAVELAALIASVYYVVRPPLKATIISTGVEIPGWPPVKWTAMSHISIAKGPYWLPWIRVRVLAFVPLDLNKVLAAVAPARRSLARYRTAHFGTPLVLFGPDVDGDLNRVLATVRSLNPHVRTDVSSEPQLDSP